MRNCCLNGTPKLSNCHCCSSESFQVEIRTVPPALQMQRHQHACLVTWATISPLITRVGLLFHAGTSKCATLSLHLDYIIFKLLQLTLHSKHIASLVVINIIIIVAICDWSWCHYDHCYRQNHNHCHEDGSSFFFLMVPDRMTVDGGGWQMCYSTNGIVCGVFNFLFITPPPPPFFFPSFSLSFVHVRHSSWC